MSSPAKVFLLLLLLVPTLPAALAQTTRLEPVTVARGLVHPWGLAFLPDGRMLVTERPGRMRIVARDGTLGAPIAGLPPVVASGQGGLLDVALDPKFADNARIYWTYSEPAADDRGGNSTAAARGRLDGNRLVDVEVIFRQQPKFASTLHFGSRLAFARDGTLYIGLGDRFTRKDDAQTLDTHHGKVVRIEPDGRVPADNPFVGRAGALPEIWSYGHRNIQGAAHRTPPPASCGRSSTVRRAATSSIGSDAAPTTAGPSSPTVATTARARRSAKAPSAPTSCRRSRSGCRFDRAQRHGLRHQRSLSRAGRAACWSARCAAQQLVRLELDGNRVVREERLLTDLNERIRDVRQGPDGWIYLLTDSADGRILRLSR